MRHLVELDDAMVKAVIYALGASIPNEHYDGWQRAARVFREVLEPRRKLSLRSVKSTRSERSPTSTTKEK